MKSVIIHDMKLEIEKVSALNLGNGQDFAFNIYFTNKTGSRHCVARIREEKRAIEIFEQYERELAKQTK